MLAGRPSNGGTPSSRHVFGYLAADLFAFLQSVSPITQN
jgi:hypothetical protein